MVRSGQNWNIFLIEHSKETQFIQKKPTKITVAMASYNRNNMGIAIKSDYIRPVQQRPLMAEFIQLFLANTDVDYEFWHTKQWKSKSSYWQVESNNVRIIQLKFWLYIGLPLAPSPLVTALLNWIEIWSVEY